jgi:hypothetical protein
MKSSMGKTFHNFMYHTKLISKHKEPIEYIVSGKFVLIRGVFSGFWFESKLACPWYFIITLTALSPKVGNDRFSQSP